MLTIKKRGCLAPAFVAACLVLTGCGPPGFRALHKGDRLIQSGKYEQAVETLKTATNLLLKDALPVQAKARNLLGLAYHHAGDQARARECYLQALALDRNAAAEANYNLGCLDLEQTNLFAAKDALTTYTSLRTLDWNGFMKLGMVNYRLATGKAPVTPENRQLNFDNARKAFEASQHLQATAEAWNNLALIDLLRRPNPSREAISNAVVKFKTALLRDPHYAPALFNLAVIYDPAGPYKFGDVQSAIDAYRKYLALDPPPPHAAEVGLLVTNLDQTRRFTMQLPGHVQEQSPPAVTPYSNGFYIKRPTNAPLRGTTPLPAPSTAPGPVTAPLPAPAATNPSPPATLLVSKPEQPAPTPPATVGSASNTPVVPSRGGPSPGGLNPPAAKENIATETNLPLASTPVRKPSLLSRLFGGKSKPAEGGADSATGPAANPAGVTPLPAPHAAVHYAAPPVNINQGNRPEAERLVGQGAAAEKESRWKDAVGRYEEAVKADPAYYEACEALGLAAIKAEEYAIALEALHHALMLQPQSPNARYGYAWALQKKDYLQDAANELEKLLAQHPDETRAHLLLGNLYAQKLGQPDLARAHYLKVLEKDPQNAQAAALRAWLQNNPVP